MLNKRIPYFLYRRLWGDRKKYGLSPYTSDREWLIWQKNAYTDFYQNTQQKGIGNRICNMAYPVISKLDFSELNILEIGPGILRHLTHIRGTPNTYTLCDTNKCVNFSTCDIV